MYDEIFPRKKLKLNLNLNGIIRQIDSKIVGIQPDLV